MRVIDRLLSYKHGYRTIDHLMSERPHPWRRLPLCITRIRSRDALLSALIAKETEHGDRR